MPLAIVTQREWSEYPTIKVLREYFMAKAGDAEFFHEASFLKYVESVKHFTEFLGHRTPEQALEDLGSDPEAATGKIQAWLRHLRERGNAPATQRLRYSQLKRWGEVNDLEVKWKKVTVPKVRPVISDRAPTKQELRKILAYSPTWLVPTILTLASSGMRVGGLTKLKLKHVDLKTYPDVGVIEVPPYANKAGVGYYTCVTSETKEALGKHLQKRRRNGERLTPESPLIKAPMSEGFSYQSVKHAYHRTLEKAGLDMKSRRVRVLHLHSLRKFFRSQVEGILTKSVREAMMGHVATEYLDRNYLRIPLPRLVQEYRKAIPALTIFEDVQSEEFQKRQLLRQASLLLPEEKLGMLREILARTVDLDDAVEEFRKLREEPDDEARVVEGEDEMVRLVQDGWELVRELNDGDRFLMRR